MAVFLINICKFSGCGMTFPNLSDLIQHIEDTHIDYDPHVVEQKEQAQPAYLPLSYVLRFITDAAKNNTPLLQNSSSDLKRKLAIKHHSYSLSSNRSNTPTGSDFDEDEISFSDFEDSNDSWTTEEFSSEFIMRYGSRSTNKSGGGEKPFACPVPGCKKRYKNVNGIKYHSKNGHKKSGKIKKRYKCHCGKSYKTAQGLKNHTMITHNSSSDLINTITTSNTTTTATANENIKNLPLVQTTSIPISSLNAGQTSENRLKTNLGQQLNNYSQSSPATSLMEELSTSPLTSQSFSDSIVSDNTIKNNSTTFHNMTDKTSLIFSDIAARKRLKLSTTTDTSLSSSLSLQQQQDSQKSILDVSTLKISLPNLANLSVLSSASTSPEIQQQQEQLQQHQLQRNILNYTNFNNCNSIQNSNCENFSNTHLFSKVHMTSSTSSITQSNSKNISFHSEENNTLDLDDT